MSGESLKFDGHLVNIEDLKGENETLQESKLPGGDCTVAGETGIKHQQVQIQNNYSSDLFTSLY